MSKKKNASVEIDFHGGNATITKDGQQIPMGENVGLNEQKKKKEKKTYN